MINEAYCSYEVSKLLKERGMDKEYFTHYIQKNNTNGTSEAVTTCTHQMAMHWLREVHHIAINIGWGEIFEDIYQWWSIVLNMDNGNILYDENYNASYEDAVETALKILLNDIKK